MIDEKALDTLFRTARTQNGFLDKAVSDEQLRQIYDLAKWGPTTQNSQPMRIVFVRSNDGEIVQGSVQESEFCEAESRSCGGMS